MKRNATIFLIIILLLILSSFSVYAEGNPTIAISQSEAKAGQSIEVPVVIRNNPGLYAIKFELDYNHDVFEYVKSEAGEVYTESEIFMGPPDKKTITFTAENNNFEINNFKNGKLVTFFFNVKKDATNGGHNLKIIMDYGSTIDNEANEKNFEVKNGLIKVTGGTEPTTIAKITDKEGKILNTDKAGNLVEARTDDSGNIITTEQRSTVKASELSSDNKNEIGHGNRSGFTAAIFGVPAVVLVLLLVLFLVFRSARKENE